MSTGTHAPRPATSTTEIRMKTNLNNKLCCDRFFHIEVQGPNGIPEPELETRLFKFIPADRSHPPVFAKAFNSCPQQLGDMNDAFTWLSHNMSAEDFKREVLAKVPGTTLETWMVTYFYKKV